MYIYYKLVRKSQHKYHLDLSAHRANEYAKGEGGEREGKVYNNFSNISLDIASDYE